MIKRKCKCLFILLIISAIILLLYEKNHSFNKEGVSGTGEMWTAREGTDGLLYNYFSPGLNKGVYTLRFNYENDTGKDVTFRLLDMEQTTGLSEGDVEIRYVDRKIYKLGDWLTVGSICGVAGYGVVRRRRARRLFSSNVETL